MIRYMVIKVAFNFLDIWTEVLVTDIVDIQDAEATRTEYLKYHPDIAPENVTVIQYKE